MKNLSSKRLFKVVGFEKSQKVSKTYTLAQLLTDDGFELTYSLQEIMDKILDLKINQTLFVDVIRGCEDSKGVLIRIS